MAAPAAAEDAAPVGLSEIRGSINVTGVELWTGFRPYLGLEHLEAIDTVEVEFLFTLPNDTILSYVGDPRLSLGIHGSLLGRASQRHGVGQIARLDPLADSGSRERNGIARWPRGHCTVSPPRILAKASISEAP